MSDSPGVSIGVILKGGKILVEQHEMDGSSYSGLYTFPGGRIEPKETPEQALVRELREELGIKPVRFEKLCVFPAFNKRGGVSYDHYYLIHEFEGSITKKTAFKLFWIDPSDYRVLDVKSDREAIQILNRKKKLPYISRKMHCFCPSLDFRSRMAKIACERGRHSIMLGSNYLGMEVQIPLEDRHVPSCGLFLGEHLTGGKAEIKHGLEIGAGKYAPASFCAVCTHHKIKIDAVEVQSGDAQRLKRLVRQNGLEDRIKVYVGNLYDPIPIGSKYDLIFSNIAQMPLPKGRKANPHDHGGRDGWKFLSKIIEKAPDFLEEKGYLALAVFGFLGVRERNNRSIPSLFERLDENGFIPLKSYSFLRKMRWGGETHKSLEHITKLYPRARFYSADGKRINPLENAKAGLPIFLDINVVISKMQ